MPETPITYNTFASPMELAANLAEVIAGHLAGSLTARKHASLVVSGGSTPEPLFCELSRKKIDWQKVTITLADERWVESAEPSSNEFLVRSLLLQNEAADARFVSLKNNASSAAEGELECHEALGVIMRPFDAVILGMGDDGHTASLFPGAEQLSKAIDMRSGRNCLALNPPDAPHERMTMTLPALLDSREIILHIAGDDKKRVLERALAEGPPNEMPIRWILRQHQTPVRIFWAP